MKQHTLRATMTLLILPLAFSPRAHAQFTGDRGRPVDQMPLVMRSLVIDVLSKGLQSGSRPLLRRVLADTVMLDGVLVEREAAIDMIVAGGASLHPPDHHLVMSSAPADSTARHQRYLLFSMPDSVEPERVIEHEPSQFDGAAHSRHPVWEANLGRAGTVRVPASKAALVKVPLPAAAQVSQFCVFTLDDKTRDGAFRVTSISFDTIATGR